MEKIGNSIEKPVVLVLSKKNYNALSIVRSLGRAGYIVDLLADAYKEEASVVASRSKYLRSSKEIVIDKEETDRDSILINALIEYAKYEKKKVFLFPADDQMFLLVDSNRNVLEPYFIMPFIVDGKEGEMAPLFDKSIQTKKAREAGLLTKKEWLISLDKRVALSKDIIYPCFCELDSRAAGIKKDKKICENAEELRRHINILRNRYGHGAVIVTEQLSADMQIQLSGVCLNDRIIIPAITKSVQIKNSDENIDEDVLECIRKSAPFSDLGNLQEKIINMLRSLHYTGTFEMAFQCVGKDIYFSSMELSSGVTGYICLMCGVNLPEIFIKGLRNEQISDEETKILQYDKTYVNENTLKRMCLRKEITHKELKDYIKNADVFRYYDAEDPEPGKIFAKNNRKRAFQKTIKSSLKGGIKRNIFPILRPVKYAILQYPQMKKKNDRDPNSPKPRVIVSGRNYGSNLCIARAIGKAGYEVEVLRIFHRKPKKRNLLKMIKPEAYSKYVKAYHVCVYGGQSKRVVNKLIRLADPDHKMLIVPADDLVASIVDDYLKELSEYYVLPNVNNKAGEINRLMEKAVQKKLAREAGLPVINSCVIRTVDGEFEIPDSVSYPCFIKPNVSKNGAKTKMRKCDSEVELREALTELSEKKDVEMLVEDYIEIKREYSLLGVSTKKGAIGPGYFGAEEGGQNEHRGVAITGEILPCSIQQKLIDDLVRFIGSLNYDGLYDVDLIESESGKMYFVELNMRFGGSGYAITESGVNLPGMFADYMLLDKPIDKESKVEETGKRFVSEKVLLEEYIKSRMTMSRYKEIMEDVDIHFIKSDEDPQPFKHFKKFYLIAALMRVFYKIRESRDSEFGK